MEIQKVQRDLLDGMVRSFPKLGLDRRAENFVRIFEKHLPRESAILDVGGGWGFYVRPLGERGHHVTVLDVVKPGYQKAPVVIYDGKRIPFADESFDVSLLITVLHHVPSVEAIIREVRRVTRKVVVVVEDVYHHRLGRWWTSMRDRIYNFEYFGHPCNFKKSGEWIELFECSGFSLLEHQNIHTWLSGMRILNGVFVFKKSEKAGTWGHQRI